MASKAFSAITYDNKHKASSVSRGLRVKALFDAFTKDAAAAGAATGFSDPTKEFYLKDFPAAQAKVQEYLTALHDGLQTVIEEGNESAWALSNSKNDAMVQDLMHRAKGAGVTINEERQEQWMQRNTDALKEFNDRRVNGMNLSDRVWKLCDQTKTELEMALEIGLGDGKSAADLSREVRGYLKEPDRLFRRVRDKKTGAMRLSKAAQAYHPGRGVYRSSYKNAIRMTATENNMAYRTADHTRWNQMDFILGQEIHLSNNHTLNGVPFTDICDVLAGKYPKEFKFVGWHPWCRCFVTSILPSLEDFAKYAELDERQAASYDFGGKKIDKMPPGFNKWMLDPKNIERMKTAKNLPYWIKDNFVADGYIAHSPQSLRKGLNWVANPKNTVPTIDDIAAARHAARPDGYRENLLAMRAATQRVDALLEEAKDFEWYRDMGDWTTILRDVRFDKTTTLQRLEDRERIVNEYMTRAKDALMKRAQGALNAAADFRGSGMTRITAETLETTIKDGNYVAMRKNAKALGLNVRMEQRNLLSSANTVLTQAGELSYAKRIQPLSDALADLIANKTAPYDYAEMRSMAEDLKNAVGAQKKLTMQTSTNVYKVADKYKSATSIKRLQSEILKLQRTNDYVGLDAATKKLAKAVVKQRAAAQAAAAQAAAQAAQAAKAAQMASAPQLMTLREQFGVLKKYQSQMKPNSIAYRYIDRIENWLSVADKYPHMGQMADDTIQKLLNQKGFMKIVEQSEGTSWMYKAGTPLKAGEFPKFPDIKGTSGGSTVKLSGLGFDELKKEVGEDMPPLLQNYEKSVKRTKYTDKKYLNEGKELEKKLKDYFEGVDYAHRVDSWLLEEEVTYGAAKYKGAGLYINEGIPTNLQVNEAGVKAGRIKGWSLKGVGYDEGRRSYGHFAYGFQDTQTKVAAAKRLAANEYYRCGTPVPKGDRTRAWSEGGATGYGDCQIILRKDNVIATWTYDNSLGEHTIPSLVSDPKVCSIDSQHFRNYKAAKYEKMSDIVDYGYVELQYIPLKGKNITPYDFESMTFDDIPTKKLSKAALERYHECGVDIYYWDGNEAKLWKKGKPQVVLTAAEETAIKDSANQLLMNAAQFENKDLDLKKMRDLMAKKDYISVNEEGKNLAKKYEDLKTRREAMKDLIPDVDAQHKSFTIDELEACHKAIKSKLAYYETKYGDDYAKIIERLEKEAENVEHPELNPYARSKTKYPTWKISQDAYKRRIKELQEKIDIAETRKELDAWIASGTQSPKIKDLLKEAEELLNAGDYKAAGERMAEAEKVRAQNAKALARRKAREAKTAAFGEATGIQFSPVEYTRAKKEAAKWFQASGNNPTMEALQKAFNEADEYMSRYASDLWSRLTDEEKHVAYLYTTGSRYINEPLQGTFYCKEKYGLDGKIRKSNHDINMLTSIIEKAKPLEEAMWVEHAEDTEAFIARFGINPPTTEEGLKRLKGREAINDPFMSTSCAADGLFTKTKEVIIKIYCPEGTKGIYCEPFAHWGDGKLYGEEHTRYGKKAIKWTGERRKENAGDQVEFLLQRGTKLRITKAEYKGGKWYFECDIVEQTARKTFNKNMSIY